MLLSESEGKFSYDEWSEACRMAMEACCGEDEEEDEGGVRLDGAEAMDIDAQVAGENLDAWLRGVVAKKVESEQRWKSAS
jgi:exosome complex component RRP46